MSPGPSLPWSLSEARSALLTIILGGGLMGLAWWQSSGTGKLAEQSTWVGVGVVALAVIGAGNLLWVVSGRRAVRVRRDELVSGIEALGVVAAARLADSGDEVVRRVAVAGTDRYHREGCLLVRDKRVKPVRSTGRLRPCEMCDP